MYKKDFKHRKNDSFTSRYFIYREEETIYIQNKFFPGTVKEPKMRDFYAHAGNIPELLEAILFVFKAPVGRGEYKNVNGYDEELTAGMLTEWSIDSLSVRSEREGLRNGRLDFHFDRGEIPESPEQRIPTPAMVWVMDRLKEEYEAWKEEQE